MADQGEAESQKENNADARDAEHVVAFLPAEVLPTIREDVTLIMDRKYSVNDIQTLEKALRCQMSKPVLSDQGSCPAPTQRRATISSLIQIKPNPHIVPQRLSLRTAACLFMVLL